MYPSNERLHRYPRNGTDPHTGPVSGGSSRGSLIALLIILGLVGGLIAYSSLVSPPADSPSAGEADPPQSIVGSGAPEKAR